MRRRKGKEAYFADTADWEDDWYDDYYEKNAYHEDDEDSLEEDEMREKLDDAFEACEEAHAHGKRHARRWQSWPEPPASTLLLH